MESQEANKEKKRSRENSLPHCGDFQTIAEMMKTCCAGEDGPIDCWTMMRKMMSQSRGGETGETEGSQKTPNGEGNC